MADHLAVLKLNRGDLIDRLWVVLDLLGEGGNGSVYLAQPKGSPNAPSVAIKILHESTGGNDAKRFSRERDILSSHQHPNIVACKDFGLHDTFPYVVLEFAAGGSLHHYLRAQPNGILPAPIAAWIVYQALAGMRASSAIHRDLKPDNLLLTLPPGSSVPVLVVGDTTLGSLVKVADFGLARDPGKVERMTMTQEIIGTPLYLSPEQGQSFKSATHLSDIYSLGVVLFECLTGTVPFDGDTAYQIIAAHIQKPVVWPRQPSVDPGMRAIVDRCLAKDPKDRFQELMDLQEALLPFLCLPATWSYLAVPSGQKPVPRPWIKRLFGRG